MHVVPEKSSKLILLCPPNADIPGHFKNVVSNTERHQQLLRDVQRLRGNAYLADGAVQTYDLSHDGRHRQRMDAASWHMIGMDADGTPHSCLRYWQHDNTVSFRDLALSTSAIARSPEWGFKTRAAVEQDLQLARALNIPYVELGGWAIAPEIRGTSEVLRIALATYAVWRMLGGAVGIGTVTLRHQSASIVKRLGGKPLSLNGERLPVYEDAQYGCEMELLRFTLQDVSPRFTAWVDELEEYLQRVPVILPSTVRAAGAGGRAAQEAFSVAKG
ncbi:MAG: hypothetical protein ABI811_13600 [Acidobacteriota bacterium]